MYIENGLKEIENCFELTGDSSYKGFELPGVDCSIWDDQCLAPSPLVARSILNPLDRVQKIFGNYWTIDISRVDFT